MNLKKLMRDTVKDIESKSILKDRGTVILMKIREGKTLKEHQSISHALLILISGKALYEEEQRAVLLEENMDTVEIPPHVTHKVSAEKDSTFLLIH
ncbi:MAG: hypothetical protein KDC80_01110 [Saprospiraceae bacterium]|nr:hypothetical protein [Saprospiraceae bacterium]